MKKTCTVAFFLLVASFIFLSFVVLAGLYNKDVFNTQRQLKNLGYNAGAIDGIWGKNTKKAIKQFQSNKELSATGELDEKTKEKLAFLEKKKVCDHTTIADDISGLIGRSLEDGRVLVMKHFNITKEQFKAFNIEGLKKQWRVPPKSARNDSEYKYLYKKGKKTSTYKEVSLKGVINNPALSSCYKLGFRLGRCTGKLLKGIDCDPENEFDMPPRCKNMPDTIKGITAGLKSVN